MSLVRTRLKTTIEVPNDACYSNNEALVNTVKDALEVSNDAYLSNSGTLTNMEVPNDACLLNNEAVTNTVNDTLFDVLPLSTKEGLLALINLL